MGIQPRFGLQGGLGRWILQRRVKNGSEGHYLGTLEKRGLVAGRAPWQVALQSWQKLTEYSFLQVGAVAEPRLRAPADNTVR